MKRGAYTACPHAKPVEEAVQILAEHEDQELDQLEGLRFAAGTLLGASGRVSRP